MDKKINLNLDFGIDRTPKEGEDASKIPTNQKVTSNYLAYAVRLANPQGLPSDKRRIWANLEDRLEKAVEGGEDGFTVNQYEYQFIKEAFDKATVPANEAGVFTEVETAVLNAADVDAHPKK